MQRIDRCNSMPQVNTSEFSELHYSAVPAFQKCLYQGSTAVVEPLLGGLAVPVDCHLVLRNMALYHVNIEVESAEWHHVFLLIWVPYCQSFYLLPFPNLWVGHEQLLHGWVQSAGLMLCRPAVDNAL